MAHEIVSELDVERLVEEKTAQFLSHVIKRMRNSLISWVSGWLNNARYNFGVSLAVETFVEPNPDEIVFHLRAYIPPDEMERIRRSIREDIRKGLIDRDTRLRILGDLILRKLSSSTGELGALLQDHAERPPEAPAEAGGDREEVRRKERRHRPKGRSQAH